VSKKGTQRQLTLSGTLVLLLVELVRGSTHGAGDAVGDGVVARDVSLHLLLVGLLGGFGSLFEKIISLAIRSGKRR